MTPAAPAPVESRSRRWLGRLYVANAAVLVTHEIDSAYWHEWRLFGLPGGIQLFLVLNLVLVVVVLAGLRALAHEQARGLAASWLVTASGFVAVIVHGVFLLRGDPSFTLPVSLALLAATAVLSAGQAAATVAVSRRRA